MRLETFFEKFDQLADVPNSVAKMRGLALELAVKGRLVAQDLNDTPSSVLLDGTRAERAAMVAGREIKARPSAPIEADEQPFEVPSGWQWARLSDVGYELGQKIPDKRFIYIDVGSIDSDKGRVSERVEALEPSEAPSRARKLVKRGTVIYSTVRPYLLNIAIVDRDFDYELIASTAFGILHPFTGIYNRFLFYWLRSAPFTAYVEAGMKGMAYPAINDEKFYGGYIALPPPEEQKRIVAKLDELTALCDRLEAQQQERETRHAALARASLARFADASTLSNLNLLFHSTYTVTPADLRKTILTLAVQGKLVHQVESDEPAVVSEQSIRPPRNVPPVTPEDCPHDIPESWRWERLGRLAVLMDYGTSQKADSDSTKIPVYRMGNIVGGRLRDENLKYVDPSIDDLPRLYLKSDDILFNRTNSYELVGKTGIFKGRDDTFTFASYLIRIRLPTTHLFPTYFNVAMNAPYFRQTQIEPEIIQQCGQANFNGTKLASTVVPVPPLAEQRRIVAKVDQLMALVDMLEAQLTASRTTATSLMDAIVAELTAQV